MKEIYAWKWRLDPRTNAYTDEPAVGFDDAMAALRYGVEPWRRKPKRRESLLKYGR